jgi:hypothetical protein
MRQTDLSTAIFAFSGASAVNLTGSTMKILLGCAVAAVTIPKVENVHATVGLPGGW